MTNWRPRAAVDTLRRRAELLGRIRTHFQGNALEVEVPILQDGPNEDHGIEPYALDGQWLITSAEHPLKRCVAAGFGDVWNCGPVFRKGERGSRHLPEFTMLEWYRVGWDLDRLIDECLTLVSNLLGRPAQNPTRLSWLEAFVATTGRAPTADLRDLVDGPDDLDQRELCDLVWAEVVQPAFSGFTIVDRWPADQAAQATIHADGSAARFELYVDGLELANGYQECTDSAELRQRMGGGIHDEAYLAAVEHLPPCSGVAVGFDRVVMLALGLAEISDSRC